MRQTNLAATVAAVVVVAVGIGGCGKAQPLAAVEGTLRIGGKPLDNCLITFLPTLGSASPGFHASAVSDANGNYQLRLADQRVGASVGPHRVVVQDLSTSNGIRRVEHGSAEQEPSGPPPPVRPSRVPDRYSSERETPLFCDVKPGPQTIDLDIP